MKKPTILKYERTTEDNPVAIAILIMDLFARMEKCKNGNVFVRAWPKFKIQGGKATLTCRMAAEGWEEALDEKQG